MLILTELCNVNKMAVTSRRNIFFMIVLFVLPLTSDLKGKYVRIMKYGKIRMPNKVGQNKNRRLTDVYNDNFS